MTLTTDKRQIARAASIVMVFFAVSRILGLVRQMAIAGQFGTGAEMDAYQAAFRLPDILFQLVAGGALGSPWPLAWAQTHQRAGPTDPQSTRSIRRRF